MTRRYDQERSYGHWDTTWEGNDCLFTLDVYRCGTLVIRTWANPKDPQGRLVPQALAIREPEPDQSASE